MKNRCLLVLLLFTFVLNTNAQSTLNNKDEVEFVNTIIGTPYGGFAKGLEGGGTLPAVGLPYAMTNFLAQTGENKMGRTSYVYEDKTIIGFLASHQPTVWMGDYGYVSVMPQIGNLKLLPKLAGDEIRPCRLRSRRRPDHRYAWPAIYTPSRKFAVTKILYNK